MRLYLVRHGEPVRGGAYSDLDRPLTPAGEAHVERLGRAFAWLGVGPVRIATSPAERCRASAAILAHELGANGASPRVEPQLGLDGTAPGALRSLAAISGGGTWVVVSHEPILRGICADLLDGPPRLGLRFDCGAGACFELEGEKLASPAVLAWFITPSLLEGARRVAR
jgi:phosphohistidine phosphatase SixA